MVNIFVVPPLKSITLNRISVKLCSREELFSSIQANPNLFDEITTIRMKAQWKITNMPTIIHDVCTFAIPDMLEDELIDACKKIALEIHYWKSTYQGNNIIYPFLVNHFDLVSWSPFGEIDEVVTAYNVIKFNLKTENRYRFLPDLYLYYISCYYCFEKMINKLNPGDHLSKNWILPFSFDEKMVFSTITLYWDKDHPELQFSDLFQQAVLFKNLSAMKYFLKKLPFEGRDALSYVFESMAKSSIMLYRGFFSIKRQETKIFVFVLSNMKKHEQKEIFKTYPWFILKVILTSERKTSFPYVLDLLFKFLSLRDVNRLLLQTAEATDDFIFNYGDIFMKIFEKCSARRKKEDNSENPKA